MNLGNCYHDDVIIWIFAGDSEEKQAQNTNIQPSASASTSALASLCSYGGDSSSDESDTEKGDFTHKKKKSFQILTSSLSILIGWLEN